MAAEGPVATGRLLTFSVGSGRFAVLLEDVLGVQDPAGTGAVTDRGVIFQGRRVAVVDARSLWWSGSNRPPPVASPAAVIVSSGGGLKALIVDQVDGIVEGVEMRPLPALVAPFVRDVFRGVTLHADGDRLVVDPTALARAAAGGGREGAGEG